MLNLTKLGIPSVVALDELQHERINITFILTNASMTEVNDPHNTLALDEIVGCDVRVVDSYLSQLDQNQANVVVEL